MSKETRDLALAAAFSIAGMVWERFLPGSFVGLAVLAGFRLLRTRRFFQRTPADLGIGLLAAAALLSLPFSLELERSLPQVLRLLSGILLYFFAMEWITTTARKRAALLSLSLAAIALAVLALFTVNWSLNKFAIIPDGFYQLLSLRLQDTIHPNVMAGSLVLLLPAPAAMLLFGRHRFSFLQHVVPAAAIGLAGGVLVLTKSRTGLAAFTAAMAVLVVLRWRWGWLLVLTTAAAGLGLLAIFNPGSSFLLGSTPGADTLALRLEIWSRGLYLVEAFPLVSPGMGMYGPLVDRLFPLLQNPPGSVPHAHNLFLQVAVDLGLPGLAAWLAVLLLCMQSAWLSYRTSQAHTWNSSLAAALLASLAALVVHGLADSVTWGMVRTAPLVWAIWGLATGSWASHFPAGKQSDAAER